MKTGITRSTSQSLKSFFTHANGTAIALPLSGFLPRIRKYFTGPSQGVAEARLALNIVNRDQNKQT
ncbi:MAG TPA: hypothetical protein VN653_00305 [Anaerolineales bacterium]|nr:hypothetical protein [Anaerolineales bacterium]